jgi:hypothetical protein
MQPGPETLDHNPGAELQIADRHQRFWRNETGLCVEGHVSESAQTPPPGKPKFPWERRHPCRLGNNQ